MLLSLATKPNWVHGGAAAINKMKSQHQAEKQWNY